MTLRGLKFRIAVVTCVVVLSMVLFLLSPLFYIQDVVVQGNNLVSKADIIERLGVYSTSNILLLNTRDARRRIMGNIYIGNVTFTRNLPGRLYVNVLERRPSAYVELYGNFLLLDDYGRVLEIKPYMTETLPILVGLQFPRFNLGEILEVVNETDFNSVVLYTQLLVTYDLIHRISYINVSDPFNIRILVNYLEFIVGGVEDADEKVRTILGVLDVLPDADRIRALADISGCRIQFSLELLQ
jgi:cell division protein FtsQ